MKDELINYGKKIYKAGLSPAVSGNISALDFDDNILITKSGSAIGELSESDIVKLDFDGKILEGEKPSTEKLMHISIYKKRPDIRAIIHSHAPEIAAFAVCNKEINEAILPEFALYFGKIPTAKYYLPGSINLALEVSNYFENNNTVLMKNHGVIIGAKNLKEAYFLLESLSAYAKTYIYSKMIGKINSLSKNEIKEIDLLKK